MFRKSALVAACFIAGIANAADNGFYFGAGALRSDFDVPNAIEDQDTGYKLIGGFRLLDSFAVEVNYADAGEARLPSGVACIALVGANCPDTTTLEARTTTAYAVGFLDFPLIDLFAKAGVSMVDADLRTPALQGFGSSDTGAEFAWGAGAQAHFGSLGARAEFEQFKVFDRSLNTISVSLIYTFL